MRTNELALQQKGKLVSAKGSKQFKKQDKRKKLCVLNVTTVSESRSLTAMRGSVL